MNAKTKTAFPTRIKPKTFSGLSGSEQRRAKFVIEYCKDNNASAAARRAGYSLRSAGAQAGRLLQNDKIQRQIQDRFRELAKRLDISAERVLQEYARIAFGDPRSVAEWSPDGLKITNSSDLTADAAAMVSEVSEVRGEFGVALKIKYHSKTAALDSLAKHLRLFAEGDTNNVYNLTIYASARERVESRLAGLIAAAGETIVPGDPDGQGSTGP